MQRIIGIDRYRLLFLALLLKYHSSLVGTYTGVFYFQHVLLYPICSGSLVAVLSINIPASGQSKCNMH